MTSAANAPADMAGLLTEHLGSERLVRATLSGAQRGLSVPWRKVVVRPVLVRGEQRIQIVRYDDERSVTENVGRDDATLTQLAALPFRNAVIELEEQALYIRVGKRGKPLVRTVAQRHEADLRHDRTKRHFLIAEDAPFLGALNLSRDGRLKPTGQRKFRQINEFVRILDHTTDMAPPKHPRVLDLGCGNAYLTFAVHHYLCRVRGLAAEVCGVDRDAEAVARGRARAAAIGASGLMFETGTIAEFRPSVTPDIVLSLHACDTATDDALARAVEWESRYLFSSPCCHHDIQRQMRSGQLADGYDGLRRDGVLLERMGDVLTDVLRVALLRIVGYRVDVLEFVAPEHSAKNLLIRAVRTGALPDRRTVNNYRALVAQWGVTPYLEHALGDRAAAALSSVEP